MSSLEISPFEFFISNLGIAHDSIPYYVFYLNMFIGGSLKIIFIWGAFVFDGTSTTVDYRLSFIF